MDITSTYPVFRINNRNPLLLQHAREHTGEPAAAALPLRMKFLPGEMHWTAQGAFTGTLYWELESLAAM